MSDDLIRAVHEDAAERMSKAVAHARSEFAGVRTGRATPGLVDKLPVEYYGTTVPLQQLASFSVPEARMLVITPFDKGSLPAIERAIQDSNLGLNPSNDGVAVRLAFPPLTEERRKDFVKLVRAKAEEGRNAVRAARRDARKELEALERDGDISTDDLRRSEAELDRLTKQYEAEIDEALEAKTVELMEG
ncbi:MAG TPA: ribosome recycling factor [Microthrixaceae bacterium]|nr:ribosome recycling factor [Microthrixaceae bacterium]